jgi:shikimate 5-dehydrogenase
LDEIRPDSLSSISIVVKEEERLIGYNTDAEGFIKSLEEKYESLGRKIEGSNVVLLGAGGVAKEVARFIAEKRANKIVILNRTYSKAVSLAEELNRKYGELAVAGGEDIIRGYLLNSFTISTAVINLTDKGSDGPLRNYSAFAIADSECDKSAGINNNISRTIARELKNLNPQVIIADIVLPKNPPSKTLAIAKNEGLENLLDGLGMVVYQAVPAYIKIQEANLKRHKKQVNEKETLKIFKKVAGLN